MTEINFRSKSGARCLEVNNKGNSEFEWPIRAGFQRYQLSWYILITIVFVIVIVIVGTIITINFNIEEVFQISIKKAVPITSFNLFVLKYSARKTEYSSHYSLTG